MKYSSFKALWQHYRKEDPSQGSRVGSCLTLRNELFEEMQVLTKQDTLLERGAQAESSKVRETQENGSAMWFTVSGFMVMGVVSGLTLASHCAWPVVDSGSFLGAQATLNQDGFQCQGFWEVGRAHPLLPLPFASPHSRILPVGFSTCLNIPYETSCCEITMQMVIIVPGQGGWF